MAAPASRALCVKPLLPSQIRKKCRPSEHLLHWSEAIAEWATISPRAQQEILKRRGYVPRTWEYKTRAELGARYDAVIDPYRPILAAENLDPVEMFPNLCWESLSPRVEP